MFSACIIPLPDRGSRLIPRSAPAAPSMCCLWLLCGNPWRTVPGLSGRQVIGAIPTHMRAPLPPALESYSPHCCELLRFASDSVAVGFADLWSVCRRAVWFMAALMTMWPGLVGVAGRHRDLIAEETAWSTLPTQGVGANGNEHFQAPRKSLPYVRPRSLVAAAARSL